MNFKLFLRIFFVLCLVFGFINFAIGGFALYGYYKVQKTLSVASLEVNQSMSSVKALFANVSGLTSTASFAVGSTSHNITAFMTGLENNISISKQEFYNESNYFSTFVIPDSGPQQSRGISIAFRNIGEQLNTTQNRLPPIINAITLESHEANGSLLGINSSISRLNQSFYLIANNLVSEIDTAGGTVSLAILGFAFYSALQGVIFIMLGLFILYLIKNLYGTGKQAPQYKENGSANSYNSVQSSEALSKQKKKQKESDQSKPAAEKGKRKGGLMKEIKDNFGIED